MFTSILLVTIVGVAIYGIKRWQTLPESERNAFAKKALLYGGVAVVLGLVLAGRAHWLMGVLAALLALAARVAQFAHYAPVFKKFMGQEDPVNAQHGGSASPASSTSMSRAEAAAILGITIDAKPDAVRQAHKRLMQKLHPDRGGSDPLAKQINQAKDVLMG
ncbi:molecular chaperone DnaJ [Arenicella xantha]|uniref:J domain-containing protein n=1 Tax=Arenicella xantha TaxID=644221 RepID=A0A395JIW2_9GAMM|nr:molecular chaperone DnaJ [Arenicella xantha]RBP49709.1 hypothetical protein DFR28_103134 [Arenicella xantha]